MKTRNITTNLVGRRELFKLMALSEALNEPILFNSVPGIGKTQSFIDYAASAYAGSDATAGATTTLEAVDHDDIYILEVDGDTRASAIKGNVNLKKLVTDKEYEMITPAATAKYIMINEIDKGSDAIRNALLGVLNEKRIFNGEKKVPCQWKMLLATCNNLPKDNEQAALWDRFLVKYEVSRLTAAAISGYYTKGGKNHKESFTVNIPEKADIDGVVIAKDKLDKFLAVAYAKCSDRTLTKLPRMIKAVSLIWEVSVQQSMVLCAKLLLDATSADKLSSQLHSTEMKNILSKISLLQMADTPEEAEKEKQAILSMVQGYVTSKKITNAEVKEIAEVIRQIEADNA